MVAQVIGGAIYLFGCHRLLRRLVQFLKRLVVVAEILLASNKDYWQAWAEMEDFRDPLDDHINQRLLYHCHAGLALSACDSSAFIPSPERCPTNPESRQRSR